MSIATYQVMPDLAADEYERLKASVAESGVLVAVELDEHGAILDGHHRVKAWNELLDEGAQLPEYPTVVRGGLTDAQKRNHARTLNVNRRQLSKEARDQVIVEMRQDGMTLQAIADAVGVSVNTAWNATRDAELFEIEKLEGKDGKARPTSYAPRSFIDDTSDHETDEDLTARLGPAINGSDPYPDDDDAIAAAPSMDAIAADLDDGGRLVRARLKATYSRAAHQFRSDLIALEPEAVAGILDDADRTRAQWLINDGRAWFARFEKAISRGIRLVEGDEK